MAEQRSFQELNRSLLKSINKVSRFSHHIVFISTYLKFKCIPKGFKLRFHSYLKECSYSSIIGKCSHKLMEKTLNYYRRNHKEQKQKMINLIKDICNHHPLKKHGIAKI